jgi:hypothetical protein
MTDARKVAFRQIAEASLAADTLVPRCLPDGRRYLTSDIREEDHLTSALTAAHRLARSTQIMRRRLLQRILSRLHAGRGIHSDPVAAGGRKDWNLSAATYCRSQSTKNQDARATK